MNDYKQIHLHCISHSCSKIRQQKVKARKKDTVVIQRQVVLFNCVNFNFMYYTH